MDVDLIATVGNGPMQVHHPDACAGEYCSVHNPSDHPLIDRPLYWRGHVMERTCRHGVGHPDPDDTAWRRRTGQEAHTVHGCDGCCFGKGPA